MTAEILSILASVLVASSEPATGSPAEPPASDAAVDETLRRMSERLEALERDNAALRGEVTELREQARDPWLTEQRATEIRALVQDVLADADSRASLQASGMTAGWDNGFFLSSPDGRFRLEIDGQLQFRYMGNYRSQENDADTTDQYRGGFENTRTRLTFRGHVFDRSFTYLVRGAFSRGGGGSVNEFDEPNGGQFQLLDAWMRWEPVESWAIRAGQFKLPFSREELVSSAYQLAIDRSLVSDALSVGRSQGIELEYEGDALSWALAFSDGGTDNLLGLGSLAGTSPSNTPFNQTDTEYAFTSRLEWKLAGDWQDFKQMTSPPGTPFGALLGIGGHYQQGEYGEPTPEANWLDLTADASLNFSGATLFASGTYSYVDTATFGNWNIYGFVVQGGFYVAPKWEIFARYEFGYIDSNDGLVDEPNLNVVTAGVNWYIDGQDLKWSFDIGVGINDVSQFWAASIAGYRPDGNDTRSQLVFRTQFQLLF